MGSGVLEYAAPNTANSSSNIFILLKKEGLQMDFIYMFQKYSVHCTNYQNRLATDQYWNQENKKVKKTLNFTELPPKL